jgi:hypothetical protein
MLFVFFRPCLAVPKKKDDDDPLVYGPLVAVLCCLWIFGCEILGDARCPHQVFEYNSISFLGSKLVSDIGSDTLRTSVCSQ